MKKAEKNETRINCHCGNFVLPKGLIRLHVSLAGITSDESRLLKRYGGIRYGETITRDIVVHDKITLRSLHYLLQRAFGFTNNHMHNFSIDDKDIVAVTDDNIGNLLNLRGVIFTYQNSDQTDYEPEFQGGSIKHWMSCMYNHHVYLKGGEELWDFFPDSDDEDKFDYCGYTSSEENFYLLQDVKNLNNRTEIIVPSSFLNEITDDCCYVKNIANIRQNYLDFNHSVRYVKCDRNDPDAMLATKMCFGEMTIRQGMEADIESVPQNIIERLPIASVLSMSSDYLPYDVSWRRVHTTTMLKRPQIITSREIKAALKNQKTIMPAPFTDALYYTYDYGDNWNFIITGSRGCSDLIEEGIINEDTFNKTINKALKEWRPVLIAHDGDMLIEDVGGINGMIHFLKRVNIRTDQIIKQESDYVDPASLGCCHYGLDEEDYLEQEKYTQDNYKRDASDEWLDEYMEKYDKAEDENGYTKAGLLRWGLSQGWHKNDFKDIDLL